MHKKKPVCIEGKALELLKQLLQDGYVYTGKNGAKLRFIQKMFSPSIKRAKYQNRTIYYLHDKSHLALQELMSRDPSRIINCQELAKASQIFNTELSKNEKNAFFGKKPLLSRKRKQRSREKQKLVLKENEGGLDDFFGRFLHSDVLWASSSESTNQRPEKHDWMISLSQ